MNIKGKIVTLRAITKTDLQMIVDMFNDSDIENVVVGWAFPLSYDQQLNWFEKNMNDQKNLRFVIETIEDGAVGIATLTNIDWKNRTATHGIKLINNEIRKKGIGTDAVMAIEKYAFKELGLHRLESSRFDDNIPSKKLFNKCGWKEEGIKRSCIFKNGLWRDLVIIGILDSDYEELIKNNHYWDI